MTLHDYADLPFDMPPAEWRGPKSKQAKLTVISDSDSEDENRLDPHHVE